MTQRNGKITAVFEKHALYNVSNKEAFFSNLNIQY